MAALFAAHPDDVDARAFYALSLLGLAHGGRDYPLYMRSAGRLEEVFASRRDHPGVLHYLIHAYDDPTHAPLGVRAARLYGEVAPETGHALHMTSHIFLALGRWEEVGRVKVQAMEVVNRQRAAGGRRRIAAIIRNGSPTVAGCVIRSPLPAAAGWPIAVATPVVTSHGGRIEAP